VNAIDRIQRCAQAIANQLGGNHLRFLPIVAVVLFLDESANNTDDWSVVMDPEYRANYAESLQDLRERLAHRSARAGEYAR
jgi:hypothetical protein